MSDIKTGRTPGWDEGYEVGYRDGENGICADWAHALDGVMDAPTPTKVRARLEALEDLLRRYIRHVVECEGTDFIEGWDQAAWHESSVEFTDEEWAELSRLATGSRPQR